jgi:DNA polymerase-3 subunit epsilon
VNIDQTHWIASRPQRPLPTFYYHGHFLEMLDFVEQHYSHVLLRDQITYIQSFRLLTRDAQCLYVRLVNRKGRIFAADRLRYPELGNQQPLLEQLREQGWIGSPGPDAFQDMLRFLTRSEIYDVLLPRVAGLSRSLKKADLVEFTQRNVSAEEFVEALSSDRILVQRRAEQTRFLLFLYFGRVQDGLSKFTMRDLGLVRTQSLNESYEARFSDSDEAKEHYFFACRLHEISRASRQRLDDLCREHGGWPEVNYSGSAALRDKLAFRLGRWAEKDQQLDLAIKLYSRGESTECSERLVRLLLKNDRRDEAREHLERCIDDPRSDEELLVARDLYERKFNKKRTSPVTDLLRSAATIDIDESRSGSPERAAIEHYAAQGEVAYRTENLLWRTLFGLYFWDEIFIDGEAMPNSPFELLPDALLHGTFYTMHRDRIETKLALLSEDLTAVKRELLRVSTRYYGQPNGVFRWRESITEAVFALLDQAPGDAISQVLRRLCEDYANSRYGYPDLMVIDSDGARFVEIKTSGDQLRRNQLLRIRQLREAGLRADVIRIRWVLDPDQAYVVVDVETTGGRGASHRVTEIGAVRVQNGQVVERFQTLLNPQRVIPSNISRLTGITPAMVEDAPYFSDVADDFEAFMRDAIFVAHNVDFDYGFIASEFKRIGRRFRHAKLCTCASMRRLYPGQRSYSLAALCSRYNIPLKQHHRALCDAEAAAELLLMINEKRQEG